MKQVLLIVLLSFKQEKRPENAIQIIELNYDLTFAISDGLRAPCISCLFAKTNKDAPDNLCQKHK